MDRIFSRRRGSLIHVEVTLPGSLVRGQTPSSEEPSLAFLPDTSPPYPRCDCHRASPGGARTRSGARTAGGLPTGLRSNTGALGAPTCGRRTSQPPPTVGSGHARQPYVKGHVRKDRSRCQRVHGQSDAQGRATREGSEMGVPPTGPHSWNGRGGRVSLREFPPEPPHPCCAGQVPLAHDLPSAACFHPGPPTPPGGTGRSLLPLLVTLLTFTTLMGKWEMCRFPEGAAENHQTEGLKTTLACPLTVRGQVSAGPCMSAGAGGVVTATSTFTHPPPTGASPCLTGSPVLEFRARPNPGGSHESPPRPQPRRPDFQTRSRLT